MKTKVNKSKKWVAVYWPKIKAWDFFKILSTGKPSKHQPILISFHSIFSEALSDLRAQDNSIPASGWERLEVDYTGIDTFIECPVRAWSVLSNSNCK